MRPPGPMIGRAAESEQLRRAFADSCDGQPQTVLVTGDSGIGKSRLVAEITDGLDARVLVGGCVDLQTSDLPFAPFTAALRGLLADPGPESLRQLLAPAAIASLARLLPGLGSEPATPGDDARAQLFEYVLELLAKVARDHRLVLVMEDAHWIDRSSLDLLTFLVRNQQAVPGLLVIVTARDAQVHTTHPLRRHLAELGRLPWVRSIPLRPLDLRQVTALARTMLRREPDPELIGRIHRRSDGNPLFVEELLSRPDRDGDVPPALRDLLMERVRRLPDDARQAVRIAAVAGQRVAHHLLATVVERSTGLTSGLDEALRSAVDDDVLIVDGDGYAFRHALIREAVYHDLLPGERTALHDCYAEVLSDAGAKAGEVSYHLFAIGNLPRALPVAWQASREAHRALAYQEELTLLDCILQHWHDLPDTAELVNAPRADVLEQAVEVALRAGAHAHGVKLATEAIEALGPDTSQVRRALMLERRGTMRTSLGEPSALDDHRAAAEAIPDDHPARAFLLNALASRLMLVPAPEEAREVAAEALELSTSVGDPSVEASATITLAVLRARTGDVDGQLPNFARARAIADSIGATQISLHARQSESHILQAFGHLDRAIALAEDGISAAGEAGLARYYGPGHAVVLAGTLLDAGRWDEAANAVDRGIGLAPAAGFHAHLLGVRAFTEIYRGDADAAKQTVAEAAELVSSNPVLPQDPLLFERLTAELRLADGNPDEALRIVREALAEERLQPATRFVWPLLAIGARAVSALKRGGDELAAHARTLATHGPVQSAWASTVDAELHADPAAWTRAVKEWDRLPMPLPLARTLASAAATYLDAGDRGQATEALRRAAGIAADLGARPLAEQISALARRARIGLAGDAPKADGNHGLTARELEILRLVADGRSNGQIAADLYISPKTASVHVSHILGKLDVANRVEAAAAAHRLGLVSGDA